MIHRELMSSDPHSIYFVVKTKKLRFEAKKCRIEDQYTINCSVNKINKKYTEKIDMAKFWFLAPTNQKNFLNKKEMAEYYLKRCEPAWLRWLSPPKRYKRASRIISKTLTSELEINCAIKQCSTKERDGDTTLYIYQMAKIFDWDAVDKLRILYIGRSGDTFGRLNNHEKWGRILSSLSDDEDALVYFMKVQANDYASIAHGETPLVRVGAPLEFSILTEISEAALIHYFKPEFNDRYTEREIRYTKLARQVVALGYDKISIEVILDGVMGRVGTPELGYEKHSATFPLQ